MKSGRLAAGVPAAGTRPDERLDAPDSEDDCRATTALAPFRTESSGPKRPRSLFAEQSRLLELIATGEPLPRVLHALTLMVEAHAPGMLCSVLLLEDEGLRLRLGAAPSLPEAYNRAIDGLTIGPSVSSCGTAAYLREPVIVADIMADPRWASYRELAALHGLRACWSTPILAADGRVLGTFAMYCHEVRSPTARDRRLIELGTHIARIAIERERAAEAQLRLMREQLARAHAEAERARLLELFSLSPALVAVLEGPQHVFTFANRLYRQVVGNRDIVGKPARQALPELEGQGYFELLDRVYQTGEPVSGIEALVRLDVGGDRVLQDRYVNFVYLPMHRPDGVIDGVLVHALDVTEQVDARRRLEALAEERRLFALLVENSRDFIAVATPDQRVVYINPAGRALVGLDGDQDVRQATILDFFPPDEQASVAREILPVLWRDGHWDGEVQFRHFKTGVPIPVLWNGFTITDAQSGDLTAFACISRDIRWRKRAEQELRYQSQLTKTITDSAASGLFMMDPHGCPTYMNPSAERMTGYVLDEIRHAPLHDAIHHHRPDGRPYPRDECPIDLAAQTLVPIHDYEDVFIRKDGTFFPVVCTVAPLERDRVRIGAVLEVRDVTEQRRAEAERARLLEREQEALAELETVHAVGQVLSAELDLQKLVQAVTDATTALTGAQFGAFFSHVGDDQDGSYRLSAISGVPWEGADHLPVPPETLLFESIAGRSGVARLEYGQTNPGREQRPSDHDSPSGYPTAASYLAVPVVSRSGKVIGGLLFGHAEPGGFEERHENILRGIAAQTAIAIDNARLYQEARDAVRARDEFLSIAAHELRTPVTSIKGSAQLLARLRARGQLDEERFDRFLRAIVQSSSRLAELTDDLLDISRLRSGRMPLHLESVDLAALVRNSVDEASDRYEGRALVAEVLAEPCTIVIDAGRISQVLTNLIENAVKYSPSDAPVRVRLQADGEGARLSVCDQGIGLPPEALERVFEPFDRAPDATRRELPGMGLGLYICRQIVEMHGGRIWAESGGENCGSTFNVWLPGQPRGAAARSSE